MCYTTLQEIRIVAENLNRYECMVLLLRANRGIAALCCLLSLVGLWGCGEQQVHKIGVLLPLTGSISNVGKASRDAIILAAEEFNAAAKTTRVPVELIIRNNGLDEELCKKAILDLTGQGVVGLLGPVTSTMGLTVAPLVNLHSLPTISPTASTDQLSNLDDYFFRVIPSTSEAAKKTAEYVVKEKKYRYVQLILDERNGGYTESWFQSFQKRFQELDGGVIRKTTYTSGPNYDFYTMLQEMTHTDITCYILVVNALDGALIAQQLKKLNISKPLIASEWTLTGELLEYGGKAIEGMEFFHSFNLNDGSKRYLDFNQRFMARFGYSPSFFSVYSYNSATILFSSLTDDSDPRQIKKRIINNQPYRGIDKDIEFNRYGDVLAKYTLLKVVNNSFKTVPTDASN